MSSQNNEISRDDPRLNEILTEYLQAVEGGEPPDEEKLLEQYPEFADQLREFFADKGQIELILQAAANDRQSSGGNDAPTLPPEQTAIDAPTMDSIATPDVSPERGTTVRYFGDYELLEEIARGGMGVVYKARQINLNRVVALKMILAGQLASEDDVKRFYTEAEAAANLDHPGIVPIYEVGEHEGQHYFSMGFVEGESLADRLKGGPLPPREAAEYTRKVAEAIVFAHEHGVIHRDLKPANVLLDQIDQPKVTDFGLAKKTESDSNLTGTGQILGTPSYMPPEQASGKVDEIRETADVYSLGAILYALVTGRPPFQADNPLDTLMQVLEREPVSPIQLNSNVDKDLETICLKCLEKDRQRRYQSTQELAEELQRFLDGRAILARPISRTARAWRWCRRTPVVASLIGAVAVSLLAGTAVSTRFAIEARRLAASEAEQRKEAERLTEVAEKERHRADARAVEAVQQRDEAQWQLYLNSIASAQREWEADNLAAAWSHLNACRDDFRNWEYDYLYTLFTSRNSILDEHASAVTAVAISPDGTRIVSGDGRGAVKLHDARSGKELFSSKGYQSVASLDFSPDGTRIAEGNNSSVKIRSAATGEELVAIKDAGSPAAFSPDGLQIVTGGSRSSRGHIRFWNAETGDHLHTIRRGSLAPTSLMFNRRGTHVIVGQFGGIRVLDAATGEQTQSFERKAATLGAISPDGKWIVGASGAHDVTLWDATTGEQRHELVGHTKPVRSVLFSADSRQVVTASDDATIKIWDTESGEESLTLQGHALGVACLTMTTDGQRIVSGSGDRTVRIWNASVGQQTSTVSGHEGAVRSVAFSPDGTQIVSAGDRTVRIWNVATGREVLKYSGHDKPTLNAVFIPGGNAIASLSESGTLKVFDARTGNEQFSIPEFLAAWPDVSIGFSQSGEAILGIAGARLRSWSAATGEELSAVENRKGYGEGMAFNEDGTRMITKKGDRLIVWDTATGRETVACAGHLDHVISVSLSPDGTRLVSGARRGKVGEIKVWDLASGKESFTLEGHSGSVLSVACSPDGKRIVSGSADRTLRIWDMATGRETLTLRGHADGVHSVAFSPDGTRIASASQDGTVKIWDASFGTASSPALKGR